MTNSDRLNKILLEALGESNAWDNDDGDSDFQIVHNTGFKKNLSISP